jgi:Uma2 family endonuclease
MKPSSGVKLTYDDLLLLPDDGLRHELIDGEHYVTAAPSVRHQIISGNMHALIRAWLDDHPLGRVLYAPFDIVFTQFDVVEPDLLYLSRAREEAILTPANAQGAPELVVEIGSPSTRKRDETIKKHLYERAGVDEYWFIDPEIDVVRVYRRADGAFGPVAELSLERGDVLTTPLLPGLELHLAAVFKE